MSRTIHCDIVSAEEAIFSGALTMLIATGILGDLGIAPGHAPLLTQLVPGPIRLLSVDGSEQIYYVSGGLLEVQPAVITVLADTVVRAANLDESAAIEAKERAQHVLHDQQADLDYSVATAHLAEAVAQLRTLQQIRKKLGN